MTKEEVVAASPTSNAEPSSLSGVDSVAEREAAAWGMVAAARRTLSDYNLNDPSPERADVVRCAALRH